MKFLRITLQVVLLVFVALGPAFGATCSDASLSGVFGFLSPGFDAARQPGASVGQYVFEGNGKVSGEFTHSGSSTIFTFTGTYSVSKDCTGNLVLSNSKGVTEHHNFVIDDSKKGMQLIRTDSPQIRSGFALAQGTLNCGLTGKKQTFAFNLAGVDTGNGADLAFVGQLTLDGKGTITSGSATFSLNGTIVTVSLTGTYTEKSDCTGTLQVTPSQGNPGNFNSVLVNAGKEMLLIQTDSGTVISGNAQQ